jgi:hypothetical protein
MMNPPPRWDNLLKIQPNLFESVSGFQDLQQTLSSLSLISLTKIRDPPTHPVEVEKKEWKKKKTREREERESSETHLLLPILKCVSQSEDEQV